MATNTEKLQEILSGAQAVAPRIKTETPVQQIEESVIDVEGGVDPLEVPEIGFPTKKKKQPTAQPSTGLSYSVADEPLQSIDYGDPASFESVQELLTEGTSFAESPQAFSTTGTIRTIGTGGEPEEGGEDFFDDPADFDEFGSISEGYSVSYPGTETGSQNVVEKAISDFGNIVEFGTANPTIERVNSPVGLVATQITDPFGNIPTPGFFSVMPALTPLPFSLGVKYGAKFLDFINDAPMTYEQQQRSDFMSLAMAADPSIGTGWSTYGENVAYASVDPNAAPGIPFTTALEIDELELDVREATYAAVKEGSSVYTVDISQIDPKVGITADQVREYMVRGYIDPEFDVGVEQRIADAINNTNPAALLNEPLTEMIEFTEMRETAQERARRQIVSAATASVDDYFHGALDPFASIGNVGTGFGLEQAYTDLTGSNIIDYSQQTQETMAKIAATAATYGLNLDIDKERNRVLSLINQGDGVDSLAPEGPARGPVTGQTLDELEWDKYELENWPQDPEDDRNLEDINKDIEDLKSRSADILSDIEGPEGSPGPSDPSYGAVDPGDTFGGPGDPDVSPSGPSMSEMADRDEIESDWDYDPDDEDFFDDPDDFDEW